MAGNDQKASANERMGQMEQNCLESAKSLSHYDKDRMIERIAPVNTSQKQTRFFDLPFVGLDLPATDRNIIEGNESPNPSRAEPAAELWSFLLSSTRPERLCRRRRNRSQSSFLAISVVNIKQMKVKRKIFCSKLN